MTGDFLAGFFLGAAVLIGTLIAIGYRLRVTRVTHCTLCGRHGAWMIQNIDLATNQIVKTVIACAPCYKHAEMVGGRPESLPPWATRKAP